MCAKEQTFSRRDLLNGCHLSRNRRVAQVALDEGRGPAILALDFFENFAGF